MAREVKVQELIMVKVALLIGVSDYKNDFARLSAPPKDVEAIRGVLEDQQRGNFDIVKPLIDPDRQKMEEEIESLFADRKTTDKLLFFFSGHGVTDDSLDGQLYLATCNTRKQNGKLRKSTAVAASFVQNIMNSSRSKKQIVILDCCFSGAFGGLRPKSDVNVKKPLEQLGKGCVVLASSSESQQSHECRGRELSIYTHYLVHGIKTGAADINKDGWISVDELHYYTQKKVQEDHPKMTPVMYADLQGAPIKLAKVRNRKPDPKQEEERKSDPKLEYRKAVEKIASNGQISPPDRSILDEEREKLGLLPEEAEKIEDEVLQYYQEYQNNKQRYEKSLRELISPSDREGAYSLDDEIRKKLPSWQQHLELKDEDVAGICYNVGTDLQKQSKLNEAIVLYQEAIRLDGKLAEAYTSWGDALFSQSKIDIAFIKYENAIDLNPSLAEAHKGLGDVFCTQRQIEEAEAKYREAISISPNYAEAYRGWGDALYCQEGKLEEAIAKYKKAIEINPNDPRAHYSLANAFDDQGQSKKKKNEFKIAQEKYEEAIEQNPNDAEALAGLGVLISRQDSSYSDKDQKKAALKFHQAIELNPDNAMAYYGWGEALRKQKKFKEAIEKYNTAISKNQNLGLAYNGLGKVRKKQKKWEKAIMNFQKAIDLKPNDTKLRQDLVETLEKHTKFKEAIAACEELIRVCPENDKWRWYKKMGDLLSGQDQLDKAIASYEAAIKLNPRNADLHDSLGSALYQQKKMGEAAIAYGEANRLSPTNIRLYYLANALYKDGQYKATVEVCEEGIDKYPRYAYFHNMLGNGLYSQKKMSEAEAAYREAIKILGNKAVFHYNLGDALYEQNKLSEAIYEYKKAIRINPNNSTYYNNLGYSYYRLNKQDDAIAAYRKAVNLNPQNAVFYNNLGNALQAQGKQQEARAALAKAKDLYKANGNDNKANEIYLTLLQMDGYEKLNQVGNNAIKWFNDNFQG